MARFILICDVGGDGPFEVCFPEEGVPDEDYLVKGKQEIYREGEFDIDFDDPDCPFRVGRCYREEM